MLLFADIGIAQNMTVNIMNQGLPEPGECNYYPRFGNYCHRPALSDQKGLCFWHSMLPKTQDEVVAEFRRSNSLEGVVIQQVDLSKVDLQGANMRGFTAIQCKFDHADLSRSVFSMATFNGCNFIHANLQGVRAVLANMVNCIFYEADLSQTNLRGANLTNSGFHDANMQGAMLGNPAMILAPGTGNPDQVFTLIEGASFDGADFTDIVLGPMYENAPQFREPLRQVWLKQARIQLELALHRPQTNNQKKKTLTDLAALLLSNIAGLTIKARDKRRETDEIDLLIENRSTALSTAGLAGPIYGECKNISTAVSASATRDFVSKIGKGCIGIMITTNRLSKDAKKELKKRNGENGNRLLYWELPALEAMANGDMSPEDQFVESHYDVHSL
ncbi:MAG: pentapeptide repeat-containing protein [Chloroflexi bacterium]|nr:MAG: pentapeptide repeat-containing protein [Chloroflexota bacterium]MBL1194966.1 pentapeptide repeat-containing protein [Chloroflexota bacterium]NOH12256.1 pentapeptide repeat-containing protein [Chloroflexota bacterium]